VVSSTVLLVKIATVDNGVFLWRYCARCKRITSVFNFRDAVRGSCSTFGAKMENIGYVKFHVCHLMWQNS